MEYQQTDQQRRLKEKIKNGREKKPTSSEDEEDGRKKLMKKLFS